VVSWADRVAYSCHDLEDAVQAGIVTYEMLPPIVQERAGLSRSHQLRAFINGMVDAVRATGRVGMTEPMAEALADLRAFNYERVYLRPASVRQSDAVIEMLRALVEHFADRPNLIPSLAGSGVAAGSVEAVRTAVGYVAGMTDRYACQLAVAHLSWPQDRLPTGV
jgi:dGTPase